MYNKILTAISLHDGYEEVVDKAVKMAKAFDAEISLLHVILHDFVSPAWAPSIGGIGFKERDTGETTQKKIEEAGTELKRLATNCGVENATIDVWVATSVKAAVRQVAVKEGSDLIVIGSRAQRGVDRLLVNSHGYQVVRNAPCDVLVVDLA